MKTLAIVGRLGSDPELKTGSAVVVLNANVAVQNRVKRAGQFVDETLWVRVVVFGKRAESLAKVLTKGTRVAASGDMQVSLFTGRDGQARTSVEIVCSDVEPLFDKRGDGGSGGGGGRPASGAGYAASGADDDSEIPF